jgi:hypothetical protein
LYRVFNFLHNLNIGLCPTCIKKIIFVGQKSLNEVFAGGADSQITGKSSGLEVH